MLWEFEVCPHLILGHVIEEENLVILAFVQEDALIFIIPMVGSQNAWIGHPELVEASSILVKELNYGVPLFGRLVHIFLNIAWNALKVVPSQVFKQIL